MDSEEGTRRDINILHLKLQGFHSSEHMAYLKYVSEVMNTYKFMNKKRFDVTHYKRWAHCIFKRLYAVSNDQNVLLWVYQSNC